MSLLWVAILFVFLLTIGICWSQLKVSFARRHGLYPPKGTVTLADVKDLALKGEHVLAMRAYREMTGASVKEAKAAVKDIMESAARSGEEKRGEP